MMDEKLRQKIKKLKDSEFADYIVSCRFTSAELKQLWLYRNELSEFRKDVVLEFLDEEGDD